MDCLLSCLSNNGGYGLICLLSLFYIYLGVVLEAKCRSIFLVHLDIFVIIWQSMSLVIIFNILVSSANI